MKARPLVHWWISSSALGQPVALSPARGVTITFVNPPSNGTMIEPTVVTNAAILRTALTNNAHRFTIQITSTDSSPNTRYFNAWVQGIATYTSFSIGGLA